MTKTILTILTLTLTITLTAVAQTTRQLKVYQKTGLVDVVRMNANGSIKHSCTDLSGQEHQDYVTIVVKDADGHDRQYLISQVDSLVLPTGQRVVFVGNMQSQPRYAPRRSSLDGRFPGTAGSGNVTFRWTENDPIRLNVGDASRAEQLTNNRTRAQFVFEDAELDASFYQVYFPDKSVTILNAQTQIGANNSEHIGQSGDCGTAKATRNEDDGSYSFTLEHKAAYLCFLPHIDHLPSVRIEKIRLSCSAAIAGTYQLSNAGLYNADNTSNAITLDLTPQKNPDFFIGHDVLNEQDTCAAYMVIAPQTESRTFTATYYVTDTLSHLSTTYQQTFSLCPVENTVYPVTCRIPENIFQSIDLGYDYIWSSVNMGSMLPNETGNYYTHDATEASLSGSWQLPPDDAVTELLDRCSWEWGEYNGTEGWFVSGTNNGNDDIGIPRLFLPTTGYQEDGVMRNEGSAYYWTASDTSDPSGQAHVLSASREQRQKVLMSSNLGMNARLVKPIAKEYRIPSSGTQYVDLRTHGPGYHIMVYDHAGPNGNYANGLNGELRITCAEGYKLNIRGTIDSEGCDYLRVYDVKETGDVECGVVSGRNTAVNVTSKTNDVLLRFSSDGSVVYSGLALTVTIQRQLTTYDLVVNEVEGGTLSIQQPTIDARHSTANPEDTIRLTATPAPGYVLHHIEVKPDTTVLTLYEDDPRLFQSAASASRHYVMCDTIRVRDGNWWHDESYFLMPYGKVTITPVFVNTDDDLWLLMAGNGTTQVERKYTQRLLNNGMSKFRVFDYMGRNSTWYHNNVDGYMFVDAPAGYVLQMSGTVWTEGSCDPLRIYDGFNANYQCLSAPGGKGMTFSTQTHNNVAYFWFHTDGSNQNYAGYDMTVTLKPDNVTQYNIPANAGIDLLTEHMDYLLKQGVTSMAVYSNNGLGNNYSNNCDGWLRFNLPEGYKVRVHGTLDSEGCDKFYFYDNEVEKHVISGSPQSIDYTTETNRLRIRFTSDGSVTYAGANLTVDFIKDSE